MNNLNLKKQIPKNLLVNIFSFFSTVVIGLWLTPYLLKSLGIVAYGLIPLAMFLSQYVSVILNAINMSIGRFLLISLQKEEYNEANEIFNTSLVIISFFILIQLLIMATILFDISYFFKIPNNLIEDSIWLFGLTFIGFSISLFRGVFGTAIFTYNRLDILRTIDIVQNLVRVVTIVSLFIYDEPSLKYIGIANLLASLSAIAPTLYYFKIFTPQLKINILLFSKKHVVKLSKMSTWILVNQVGVLLLGSIDLYLVNRWMGSQATGEYAIVLQFTSIFKTFSIVLSSIFIPISMIYYANNETNKLAKFTILASKTMIIGLIIPLVGLVVFSEDILFLWLDKDYTYLSELISYSMLFFIFSMPIIPLFNVTVAYNKVKFPAIIVIFLGLLNIISIYILTNKTNFGLWSIVSTKLVFEIIFSLVMINYVSSILKVHLVKFLNILFISISLFISIFIILYGVKYFVRIDSIFDLFYIMLLIQLILIPTIALLILSKEEKILLANKFLILKKLGW
jgi:membrane protein EpsK